MSNKTTLKSVLAAVLVSIIGFQALVSDADADQVLIAEASNLQKDGITAQQKGIPVLLEFSMQGCPFCEQVEEEVLKPMLISGDYDNKVMLRKVMIDEDTVITDFNGKRITYEALASRYNVFVTPTLVLVHGNGAVMGLEMVGVSSIDFYGAYLDQAIDRALNKISTAAEPVRISGGSPAS
ncbi:MAG: thioredoxin fold domain-containing protein [Gammaproteobacteria bacterium]|nr:thioredoxin fold domain-containing protein [Gammaproteobacteria bacterium]